MSNHFMESQQATVRERVNHESTFDEITFYQNLTLDTAVLDFQAFRVRGTHGSDPEPIQ